MFTHPEPEAVEAFAEHVRKAYPGGQHLADRVADGPWRVLSVREGGNPTWLLEAALAAAPFADLPVVERFSTDVEVRTVYLLPNFSYEMAHFFAEEHAFMPDYDLEMTAFVHEPGDGDYGRILVALLSMHDDDEAHVARLTDLVDQLGPGVVARRLLTELESGDMGGRDELIVFVEAWHAAITVGAGA